MSILPPETTMPTLRPANRPGFFEHGGKPGGGGALDHGLLDLQHHRQGLLHRLFVHQKDVGDQGLDDGLGESARLLDGDAFGDGLRRRLLGEGIAMHRLAHHRIKRGLRAIDQEIGLDRLGRHRNTGDQPASAHRHHQRVQFRHVLQHLQSQGALARDHFAVVIGMDEGKALRFGDHARGIIGFPQILSVLDHAGAEIAGMLDLHERRGHRHHDGGGNAQPARMIGDALGMIAGAHGDDALFLFRGRESEQPVERAALLEGRGELQILEFEKDVAAGDLRQSARMAHGGALHLALDCLRRGADIFKRDGKRLRHETETGSARTR